MRAVLGLVLYLCAVATAFADQGKTDVPATTAAELSGQLLQLLFGLLLVVAVIFLLAWLVRRIQNSLPVSKANQAIRLVATQPLGTRERLLLVQVGKEQILLGITPGSIEPLHVLQEPVEIDGPAVRTPEFGTKLKALLKANAAQEQKESP